MTVFQHISNNMEVNIILVVIPIKTFHSQVCGFPYQLGQFLSCC